MKSRNFTYYTEKKDGKNSQKKNYLKECKE